ncbi:MAG: hypothetical protein JWN98_206 [Abditibacteriota bacterium]|jgi:nitroreductase|nr:hypothetical protein [Abditibacteriota bacterium]
MDVFDAMRTRASLAKLKPDAVPRELIEQLLDVAVWAPNHKMTEPWRFWVWSGASREKLARAFCDNYRRDHPDADQDELDGPGCKTANRVLAAPVTLVVTSDVGRNETETLENLVSASLAIEHILLAAHALGLGAYWRTGEGIYTQPNALLELLQLPQSARVAGFVLLGYPESTERTRRRTPWQEKTQWFD